MRASSGSRRDAQSASARHQAGGSLPLLHQPLRPESKPTDLLSLQQLAGNKAAASRVASGWSAGTYPIIQRAARPGNTNLAVSELREMLLMPTVNVEAVLRAILMQKDFRGALAETYRAETGRELSADLEKLGGANAIRARRYLEFGTLRPADKLYIATYGLTADDVTILRVASDAYRATRDPGQSVEQDFRNTYGATSVLVPTRLPDGTMSALYGHIVRAMASPLMAKIYRVGAVLAFGQARWVDEVVIATVNWTNDVQAMFHALQSDDPKTLKKQFAESYPEFAGGSLVDYLTGKTSFHTEKRALMLLDENVKPHQRLLETVVIATSGYTTADADFIFDALQHATQPQLDYLKAALTSGDRRLKNLYRGLGSLSEDEASRFNALVGTGSEPGMLSDPTVGLLRQMGGTSLGSVYAVLRDVTGRSYEVFKEAYVDQQSQFRRFVDQNTSSADKGHLLSMVFTDLRSRLDFVLKDPSADEYLLFLLNHFTGPDERKALAVDASFGAKVSQRATAIQNKVALALRPSTLTPAERAAWLDAAVRRETGTGVGSLTGSAEALSDENRELQVAIDRAGKNPTPEQLAEIDALGGRTEAALLAFVDYRDELEALVADAVSAAAIVIATALTGGAAGMAAAAELTLASAARAAAASAISKVVARKLVMGDRFDVTGADGAAAFVSGAAAGALGAVAPLAGNAAMNRAAEAAARTTANRAFTHFASTTAKRMTEGALAGGMVGAVDAATKDATWANGFEQGLRAVMTTTLASMATGAAMSSLPPALETLITAYGTLEQLEAAVDALDEPTQDMWAVDIDLGEVYDTAPADLKVQRQVNWGFEYEQYAMGLVKQGLAPPRHPPMLLMVSGTYGGNNGIDAMGFAYEGRMLRMYLYEMKWRNLPKGVGAATPEVYLSEPSRKGRMQTDYEWALLCIDEFINSTSAGAQAAKNQMRMRLPALLGEPRHTRWTNKQLRDYLRRRINPRHMQRVIVVPPHVSLKKILKQLINLRRRGQGGFSILKTPDP